MAKDLVTEARELGINPTSYDLSNKDSKKALQDRVDGRKAEIKAVENRKASPAAAETTEDGKTPAADQKAADDGVATKAETKTSK